MDDFYRNKNKGDGYSPPCVKAMFVVTFENLFDKNGIDIQDVLEYPVIIHMSGYDCFHNPIYNQKVLIFNEN